MEESGRPRRKAKRQPTKKPNASHYVGYVYDEETPEMIMKKFEMLDRFLEASSKGTLKDPTAVKAKKGRTKKDPEDYVHEKAVVVEAKAEEAELGPDQPLTENQLAMLFKMTSSFSVPSSGYLESTYDGFYAPEDFELSDEENFFVGEDEFFGSGEDRKSRRRRKAGEGEAPRMRKRKERDLTGVGTYKPKMKLLSMELVGADGMYYTIKKKVKMIDPLQPTYVRIPSQVPLPRSWSRTIAPYTGVNHEAIPEGSTYIETDVLGFELKSLGKNFQGVLIDPPWEEMFEEGGAREENRVNATKLYNLRVDEILENGLLLIWTEKRFIASCMQVASRWGFTYVENVVWVKQNIDHTVVDAEHPFFASSKCSLLIFKKGSNFSMRHQRNPDVLFDVSRHSKYLTLDKPKYAYTLAEILLPDAAYDEAKGHGSFLEIWARRGAHRKGWTSIVQNIPPPFENHLAIDPSRSHDLLRPSHTSSTPFSFPLRNSNPRVPSIPLVL